ncbi:MAG TPA: acylphosphatase, partial [Chitinophagaceae bacterium]|nr:acylphosphatase [Chitinophagaceae bacterium]
MNTFHIHINGLVQGVGFRPFVCRMAKEFDVKGFVSNANDGVHIEFNASLNIAEVFYKKIINHPPPNAIITHHHFEKINSKIFPDFSIRQSIKENKPDILLTPDIALCNTCRQELLS